MPTCFVIQPFDNGPYDKRYNDVLQPAITAAGLEPYRVDQDPSVSVPIDDIESGIRNAEICLADVTLNNPNIWYEVGFAMAAGKAVVMICAEPRLEPYPFDVRHRHIIQYSMQSSSDFEKLKQEVTGRLKAQAEKAEELQVVAAMAQVEPTEGLSPHEVAVLMAIMSSVSDPANGVPPQHIQESMEKAGYTAMASTLAQAGLKKKGMIEYFDEEHPMGGEIYSMCRATQRGIDWMLDNQSQFRMKTHLTGDDF